MLALAKSTLEAASSTNPFLKFDSAVLSVKGTIKERTMPVLTDAKVSALYSV